MLIFLIILFSFSFALDRDPHCFFGTGIETDWYDNGLCFTFNSTLATFDEAEGYCTAMGGHLTSALDIFMSVYFAEFAKWDEFWIGGYKIPNTQIWAWKWNNEVMKYTDWNRNQPDPNYSCATLQRSTALWQSQPCSTKLPFVCQVPAVIDDCDEGWTYYYACYKLFSANNTSFDDAEASCVEYDAHLASISVPSENEFVRKLVTSPPQTLTNAGVWIGFKYPNGWTDGYSHIYGDSSFWYNGPPSSAYPYSVYIADGTTEYPSYASYWLAVNSSQSLNRYLCKKPPMTYPYIMRSG